jgi:hypothetical protein
MNYRVAELPESLPKIDFGEYKRRIASPAFVDEFEKLVIYLTSKYFLHTCT